MGIYHVQLVGVYVEYGEKLHSEAFCPSYIFDDFFNSLLMYKKIIINT